MNDHPTLPALRTRHAAEERALVEQSIDACSGSLSRMAAWLGCGKTTVQRLIEKHGLGETYSARSPGRGRPRKVRLAG